MASVFTAILVALTLLFLTPLFLHLPKAALAAIIVVAVAKLVDFRSLPDLCGAGVALALHLWRTSRPHMAVVGPVGRTEHFRNVLPHDVHTCPRILAVRVDESPYFANTRHLESHLLAAVADQPEVRHLLLICSAVNFIDGSALETLEELVERLRDAGVTLHLAEPESGVESPGRAGLAVSPESRGAQPAHVREEKVLPC